MDERNCRLGFGICANDELHGDVEYFYIVEAAGGFTSIRAYSVEHGEDGPQLGACVQSGAVPQPLFPSFAARACLIPRDICLGEFRRFEKRASRSTNCGLRCTCSSLP